MMMMMMMMMPQNTAQQDEDSRNTDEQKQNKRMCHDPHDPAGMLSVYRGLYLGCVKVELSYGRGTNHMIP